MLLFSKANSCGDDSVVSVRLAISPNMKCKSVGVETLLDAGANVANRLSAERDPVVASQMVQYLYP